MIQLFLIGRLILGGYYLFNAFNHFTNTHQMAAYAAAKGIPSPTAAVLLGGVLLAIAGVSFLLGLVPRIGVLALALFLVPVTFTMHRFWADASVAMRVADMVNFAKNLALLGSGLMFLAVPEPWPVSVESALRRRRREPASAAP